MPDVTLTLVGAGGAETWSGWSRVQIRKSMTEVANQFTLDVTERYPNQPARRFQPGVGCCLALDGKVAVVGWVDEVNIEYGRDGHSVRLTGRSQAGDLVDCDCIPPWEYLNLTLTAAVARLIAPYNMTVTAEVDVGEPFERVTINPGESVWTVIERLCRLRAVLCITDTGSRLLLTRAGCGGAAPVALELGVNVLHASGTRSWADRHSDYVALGQQENRDRVSANEAAGPKAWLTDPEITRFRPKVLIAEGQGNGVTLRDRAAWQLAVAKARSERDTCTVQGWTAGAGGPLWCVNWLVQVTDDFLGLNGVRLITGLTFTLDRDQGSLTTLEMSPPDAFLPEPGGGDA